MSEYLKGPVHLSKCAIQLMGMYAMERYRAFVDMIDDATDVDFGDDET